MRGYGTGAWFFALFECFKAMWEATAYVGQQISHTADGTSKAWNERQLAKQLEDLDRKATMWNRAAEERNAITAKLHADLAANKAKREADQAELMRQATEMAEKQAKLKELWAKSAPKSTKWEYKA